jgi:hypothetical protein
MGRIPFFKERYFLWCDAATTAHKGRAQPGPSQLPGMPKMPAWALPGT